MQYDFKVVSKEGANGDGLTAKQTPPPSHWTDVQCRALLALPRHEGGHPTLKMMISRTCPQGWIISGDMSARASSRSRPLLHHGQPPGGIGATRLTLPVLKLFPPRRLHQSVRDMLLHRLIVSRPPVRPGYETAPTVDPVRKGIKCLTLLANSQRGGGRHRRRS